MASPSKFSDEFKREFKRAILSDNHTLDNELGKVMALGLRRRRFICSLFPDDWKIIDDRYSFNEGRVIITVIAPSPLT